MLPLTYACHLPQGKEGVHGSLALQGKPLCGLPIFNQVHTLDLFWVSVIPSSYKQGATLSQGASDLVKLGEIFIKVQKMWFIRERKVDQGQEATTPEAPG